jgi:predicted pyridoxine 5'-phosphate oxidase superfamily flavin-nucleotide-binding protein
MDPALFERAARAFNSIEISKGQVVNIATCDKDGRPDVAPIGSMRVIDHQTVHVLQGFLPRTMKNLEANPLAAFSVTLRSSVISDVLNGLRGTTAPMGYRLYGQLESVDDDRSIVAAEAREIVKRAPWFFRKAFTAFCDKNLRRRLKFRIVEVRVTG